MKILQWKYVQAFPVWKHDRNFSLLTKISWNLIHKKGEIQARWQWNVTEAHAIDISATYATADSSGKVDCSHFEWLRKMSTPSFKRSVLLLANVKKQGWDLLVVSQLAIAGKYFFLAKSRWVTFKGWNNIFKLISINLGALRVTAHHAPVLHSPDGAMLLDPRFSKHQHPWSVSVKQRWSEEMNCLSSWENHERSLQLSRPQFLTAFQRIC